MVLFFGPFGLPPPSHDLSAACAGLGIAGWLSKLWSLFGYPKYDVAYYNRDPKRTHNFDNHPAVGMGYQQKPAGMNILG